MQTPAQTPAAPAASRPGPASFVALGDSFTEGMSDRLPDGVGRGRPSTVVPAPDVLGSSARRCCEGPR